MGRASQRSHPLGSQPLGAHRSSRDLSLRTHPLVFGVVVFLASELMFFGGMITSYFVLRGIAPVWPPPGATLDTAGAAFGTAFLALSSGTMLFTTHELAAGRIARARIWLALTIVLGTAFELLTIHGWIGLPFRISTNAYGSLVFMMTGFHALHVAAGVVMLLALFAGLRMTAFERDRRAGVEAIGFYWHFVFVVWVLIWGTIYVIR